MEISQLFNVVYYLFNLVKSFIQYIIEQTILKGRPELANSFSSAITIMVTLTAIYVLIVFISATRKAIGIIIAIGWILLIISIILAIIGV
ncbi:MAG: hypothetical protein LM593_05370 [Candidatus Verstraetearchaeota archaeon]|jgi:membrane-associated phospholipid phosphatase|nr:hypothetical protein [Candidatus Verstraetearchaeota archaeon]